MPTTRCSQLVDCVGNDREQRGQLFRWPSQVVCAEQPQRDNLNADLFAPADELLDLGGSGLMPLL